MRSATGQQRTNSQPTAQSSSVGGGPVTPGGRGQYNANATTPGTASQLQPRQPGASNSGGTAGGRPTTPRRLSPINTGGVKDTSAYKGTLSPKAGGGGSTSFASNSKASLSPTRASGARGPRSGARIVSSSTSSTSSTSSSTSSTNRGGASTTTSGAGAGAGGALNRVARPAPISTQNKWTRNSPPSNTQDEDESTGTIGIEEMRAQRRVFRLAAQMPEQALGGGGGTTNSSAGSAPPPLNLSKKKKKTAAASSSGGGSSNSNSKQKVRSTTRGNSRSTASTGQSLSSSTSSQLGANGLKPLIVVLDLDETLVHSTFHGSGARMYRQIEKRKSKIRRSCESFSLVLDDGDRVTVNKRPQVDDFMRALQSPEFEPHVFTAALASYASPVMDRLESDMGRKLFARRMYRDSCTPTGMGTFAKDLSTLYGDLSRVVLVDNNPISLMKQPSNGILVPSFFDDPNDDVLPTVLDFLRSLADAPDVRPVLRALKSDS